METKDVYFEYENFNNLQKKARKIELSRQLKKEHCLSHPKENITGINKTFLKKVKMLDNVKNRNSRGVQI